jgi:hypothetical protein
VRHAHSGASSVRNIGLHAQNPQVLKVRVMSVDAAKRRLTLGLATAPAVPAAEGTEAGRLPPNMELGSMCRAAALLCVDVHDWLLCVCSGFKQAKSL